MTVINEEQIDICLHNAETIYKQYQSYGDPYAIHKAIGSISQEVLIAISENALEIEYQKRDARYRL